MAIPERHLVTVDEWQRMIAAGVFDDDARLELLDGEILEMSPIGWPHAACVDRCTSAFMFGLGDRALVRTQGPVVLDDLSQPQPDVAILARRDDYYASDGPRPDVIYLLIEVADTTLRRDRHKLRRYAAAGVVESWLFDLNADTVELHREPDPDGYASVTIARRGDQVSPLAFPDVVLEVANLLP